MYTIKELVEVARKLFGVNGVLVEAALRQTGLEKFTLGEAKRIVWDFANKQINK